VPCAGYCDELSGRAPTFCAEGDDGGGLCLSKASEHNDECAAIDGAEARTLPRFVGSSGAPPAEAIVCAP
jgi:hypothetical protein